MNKTLNDTLLKEKEKPSSSCPFHNEMLCQRCPLRPWPNRGCETMKQLISLMWVDHCRRDWPEMPELCNHPPYDDDVAASPDMVIAFHWIIRLIIAPTQAVSTSTHLSPSSGWWWRQASELEWENRGLSVCLPVTFPKSSSTVRYFAINCLHCCCILG